MSDPLASFCWQLVEKYGLSGLTHQNLADLTGQSVLNLYRLFPTQGHMLLAMMEQIREKVDPILSTLEFQTQSPHDRLFEAIMSYLDALQPHENAMKKLWQDLWFSPAILCTLKPHFLKIIKSILILAKVDASGFLGFIRQRIFAGFCLYILKTWLEDSTSEKSKTLAALDQGLHQLEEFDTLATQFYPAFN